MKVLVCGGRKYAEYECVEHVLGSLDPAPTLIIHGGAAGADALANRWAHANRVRTQVFNADWFAHGRAAGPMRNAKMLTESMPDLVVAFPGGAGTAHMVALAKRYNYTVKEIT